MSKRSKISPARRREWLRRYEKGEVQDDIAKNDKVNPRTVKEQLDRARLEQSFEMAQQQQLQQALNRHQKDLLDLIERIEKSLPEPSLATNFGVEDATDLPDQEKTLAFVIEPAMTVRLTKREGHYVQVALSEEESRLWQALKQHLGNKVPLWRAIADWKRALLAEVNARSALSYVIKRKVEQDYRLPVTLQSKGQEPHFTPTVIRFIWAEVTSRALSETSLNFPSRLEVDEGKLHDGAAYVTGYMPDPEKVKKDLEKTVAILVRSAEAGDAAQTHQNLRDSTNKVREELEDYLLLHHIPGRCSICQKLGGQ